MGQSYVVERKPLSVAEKSYLPQIMGGLKITLKNLFKPKITLEYPEQRPEIPEGYRGMPVLVKDPNGRTKCVSCQLCEFVCPPKAIRIKPSEIPSDQANSHVEKIPQEFDINMLRCIYCGLCEEVCPEEAIFLQDIYTVTGESREDMVFGLKELLELGGTRPDDHYKWDKKKAAQERMLEDAAAH